MAKKLRAKEEYVMPSRNLHYKRGEVFEPTDDVYLFLMADAPGVFEVVAGPVKAIDAPPVDKMMRAPKAKK